MDTTREISGVESEPSLDRLKAFKNIDLSRSFKLEEEKDENGEQIGGEAYWVAIKDGDNVIEGKFYCPTGADEQKKEEKELVIFEPGMPGDGVVIFDKRHAPNLLKEGYYVFSARHNGTIVNSEKSLRYVNCPAKQKWGEEHGQEFIGKPFGFSEWGREVGTAIKGLADEFNSVHLVGHSMGSLNTLTSLALLAKESPQLVKRIESFVSLSGLIGRLRPDGKLDRDGVTTLDRVRGFLEYIQNNNIHHSIPPQENLKQLGQGLQTLYDADFKPFKDKTRFLFTAPDKVLLGRDPDEYCPYSSSEEFALSLADGMGDKTKIRLLKYGTKAQGGYEAHDFANMGTNFLIRWFDKSQAEETLKRVREIEEREKK